MAEALLKHQLQPSHTAQQPTAGLASPIIEIRSAGLQAPINHPADPYAVALMSEIGLDISNHRSQKVDPTLINWAELILVMTINQQKTLITMHPSARGKIFRLLEDTKKDILDPYNKDREAFNRAFTLIEEGTAQWARKLRL